jgi:hypothetical protein
MATLFYTPYLALSIAVSESVENLVTLSEAKGLA